MRNLLRYRNFAIIGVLILACLGAGLVYALQGETEYDEGYNLQVPVNLVQTGVYGTTVDWGRPFDAGITTGPTVLIPDALVFRLAGIGLTQARLVSLVYFGLALIMAALLLYRLGGLPAAVLGLVWMVGVPEIFRYGLKVLGEVPAVSFFLLALVSYDRKRPLRLGLLLGLSILTKFEFVLCLAPLVLLALLEGRTSWKFYIRVLAATLAVPLAWQLVKLVGLGWTGYVENIQGFLHVMNGATGLQPLSADSLGARAALLVAPFTPLPVFVGLAGLGTFLAAQGFRLKQSLTAAPARAWLFLFSIVFLGWWLVASKTGWPRHLLPGLCVIALTSADGAVWLLRQAWTRIARLSGREVKNGLGAILLTGAVLALALLPVRWQSKQVRAELKASLLPVQTELAVRLAQIDQRGGAIAGWAFFQIPEMSFLSQVHFLDLPTVLKQPALPSPLYVLASKELNFGRDTQKVESQYCGPVVYQNAGYILYEFKQ